MHLQSCCTLQCTIQFQTCYAVHCTCTSRRGANMLICRAAHSLLKGTLQLVLTRKHTPRLICCVQPLRYMHMNSMNHAMHCIATYIRSYMKYWTGQLQSRDPDGIAFLGLLQAPSHKWGTAYQQVIRPTPTSLTFNGTCNSPSLTSYGQNGVFGIGSHGFSSGLTTVPI